MGRINSKRKGKTGELNFCEDFEKATGIKLKRNWIQTVVGGNLTPDVKGWDAAHIEVKRTEAVHLFKWQERVLNECGHRIPVIAHRRSRADWWLFLRLEDLPMLAQALIEEMGNGSQK